MSGAAAEPSFINKQDQFNEALREHPQVQAGHVAGRVTLTVGPLEPMEPMEAPPRRCVSAQRAVATGACCAKAGLEERLESVCGQDDR